MSAEIQHRDAKRLVRRLAKGDLKEAELTYTTVSELLGRPAGHGRAVGAICDLIDAAACLAGVPLFAVGKIKNSNHEFNAKAWATLGEEKRRLVAQRSNQHQFDSRDYERILGGLDDLRGRGNKSAWKYVRSLYEDAEVFYRRLIADCTHNAVSDFENDPGTDTPDRARLSVWVYERDDRVRAEVIKRANGRCEYCNVLGFLKPDGTRYLETHHVIALASEGKDRRTNVLALCPNDHREAHFGKDAEAMEQKMLKVLVRVNTR